MVVLLILFLVLVVFLAFFIGNNLSNLCTFWLFKTYSEVPVLMLVLVAFAAGILFSILLFFIGKIRGWTKETEEKDDSKQKSKNELKAKKEEEKRLKAEKKVKKSLIGKIKDDDSGKGEVIVPPENSDK